VAWGRESNHPKPRPQKTLPPYPHRGLGEKEKLHEKKNLAKGDQRREVEKVGVKSSYASRF